jgi:hypothetical protein
MRARHAFLVGLLLPTGQEAVRWHLPDESHEERAVMRSQRDDNFDTREPSMTTEQQRSRPFRAPAARALVAAAVSVTLLAGFAPSAGRTRSDASHVLVTPAQSKAAVTAWSQRLDTAVSTFDVNILSQVEAPPLLALDTPVFQEAKARGAPAPPVTTLTNVTVSVPKQTSYPAQFLAHIQGSLGFDALYLFVKASKHDSWKAVYQANLLANATLPDVALDRHGYASTISEKQAKQQLKIDPATLGRAYSDFLNQSAQANAPTSSAIFSPDIAQQLLSTLANGPIPPGQHVFTYAAADYPTYSYRTRGGGAFSLVAVNVDIQANASGGATITYPQPLFGLDPGQRYRSTDMKGMFLVGVNVPPATTAALISSPAEYDAVISATGVPA